MPRAGAPKDTHYPSGVDGRTTPKPSYVTEMRRKEALEVRRRDWKRNFLRAYASNGNVTKSCAEAGVEPQMFHKARRDDEEFAEAFQVAHRAATDKALEAVWEIGVEGVREPIYFQGEIVAYQTTRDWKAAKFILETFDPGTYSQRERIAQMGLKREDQLNARREQMLQAHAQRMKELEPSTPIDVEVVGEDDD